MSGVVAKMFIQSATEYAGAMPDGGGPSFELGVVCRGETNKDWAAATPAGSASLRDPLLQQIWEAKRAGERSTAEVYVRLVPDPDGEFEMGRCDFAYNGCAVELRHPKNYGRKISLTVNAKPATAALRKAYADGLMAGVPPRFAVSVADAGVEE